MVHLFRNDYEAASWHRLGYIHVQLVAETYVQRARDHGKVLVGGVGVRRDLVIIGHLQAIGKQNIWRASITFDRDALGPVRDHTRAILPFRFLWRQHDGRLDHSRRWIRRLLPPREIRGANTSAVIVVACRLFCASR
jgi:hypothetical protein